MKARERRRVKNNINDGKGRKRRRGRRNKRRNIRRRRRRIRRRKAAQKGIEGRGLGEKRPQTL